MGERGKLILVVGASGAGKDTLIQWAQRALPSPGIKPAPPLRFVQREITRARGCADHHVEVSCAQFEQRGGRLF